MRGQRYEINITAKDNYYIVEVLKNGWRMVTVEDNNHIKVLDRLYNIYNDRVNRNVVNDDTRAIEKSIRAFRGYVEC